MNENYYMITATGEKVGPMSVDSMVAHGLTPNTMVWRQGLTDWVRAAQLPELVQVINTPPAPPTAPQFNNVKYNNCNMPRPNNYLAFAIISTILCCMPAGVVSIVYAAKVDSLWSQGRYDEAQAASNKAKTWAIVSLVVALVGGLCYFLFFLFASMF